MIALHNLYNLPNLETYVHQIISKLALIVPRVGLCTATLPARCPQQTGASAEEDLELLNCCATWSLIYVGVLKARYTSPSARVDPMTTNDASFECVKSRVGD
jgi:hypothetical protein